MEGSLSKLRKFFKSLPVRNKTLTGSPQHPHKSPTAALKKRISELIVRNLHDAHADFNQGTLLVPRPERSVPVFPKVRPHAPNTMLTPGDEGMSFIGRFGQRVWRLGEALKQKHVKYAFKAGMATAVLAAPAFFDRTRPWFIQYRGEWILISVMQVSFQMHSLAKTSPSILLSFLRQSEL